MPDFNYLRAAQILVEAAYTTDPAVAQKYSITDRTIRNYRSRLNWDKNLIDAYAIALKDKRAAFATIPETIGKALEFIQRASQEADATNPTVIMAITQAIATLSEVQLIDLKLEEMKRNIEAESQGL